MGSDKSHKAQAPGFVVCRIRYKINIQVFAQALLFLIFLFILLLVFLDLIFLEYLHVLI